MPKEDAAMSAYLKPPGPPSRMTVEEFLEAPEDPTGAGWQLVEGEPTMMAPASTIHGTIQANLAYLLIGHLRRTRPGCRVVTAPGIVPRVRRDSNVRIPDLAVHCGTARRGEQVIDDPILAIEILSATNQPETWANVWTYCSIPSLKEIMVIRTATVTAEILRRAPDGVWPGDFTPTRDIANLESIGMEFPLAEAYQGTELVDG